MDIDFLERAKGWSQMDLIMSEILVQTLYPLQIHITEELIQRAQET